MITLDLDALAQHCLTLLHDPKRRRVMGECGRGFATREFDVQEMVARIDRLYQTMLAQKQSPNGRVVVY